MKPLIELLAESSIVLDATAATRDDAIRQVGARLLAVDAIEEAYIEAMIDRENSVSTVLGEGVAVPHATLSATDSVRFDALSFVRFPRGVNWDGDDVRLAFGIAAKHNGHIAILSQLATVLMDPDKVSALRTASTGEEIRSLLA